MCPSQQQVVQPLGVVSWHHTSEPIHIVFLVLIHLGIFFLKNGDERIRTAWTSCMHSSHLQCSAVCTGSLHVCLQVFNNPKQIQCSGDQQRPQGPKSSKHGYHHRNLHVMCSGTVYGWERTIHTRPLLACWWKCVEFGIQVLNWPLSKIILTLIYTF